MINQIREGLDLLDKIEQEFMAGNIDEAVKLMESNYDEHAASFRWSETKAVMLHTIGRTEEAYTLLKSFYPRHRLDYECNYNMGEFAGALGYYEEALGYYAEALYLPESTDNQELNECIMNSITTICNARPELITQIGNVNEYINNKHNRIQDQFPIFSFTENNASNENKKKYVDDRGQVANTGTGADALNNLAVKDSYIGQSFDEESVKGLANFVNNSGYYTGIYDFYYPERDQHSSDFDEFVFSEMVETVKGVKGKGVAFSFDKPVKVTIPLMIPFMDKAHHVYLGTDSEQGEAQLKDEHVVIDIKFGDACSLDNENNSAGDSERCKCVIDTFGASEQIDYTDDTTALIKAVVNKGEGYLYSHMLPNRFYYYTYENVQSLSIISNYKLVAGEPIIWKENGHKAVINIFIDGLSQAFIERYGMDKLMPNTREFFENGLRCTNAFSNGEWTYPSLPSYFTGLRTAKHGMYHSGYFNTNLWDIPSITTSFKNAGFYTSRFDGDWRSTPVTGYAKDMNRCLYREATRGMKVDDTVREAIEQLSAFPETPQFIWIGIPDLHDAPDELEMKMSTQTNVAESDRVINHTNETSVQKKYDEVKVNRYIAQLKRVDTVLENLYHYLDKQYGRENYIVSLMSDHGQGFTDLNKPFLDEHRTRVPMYFTGANISKNESTELMESTDFFRGLSNLINQADFGVKVDMSVFDKSDINAVGINTSEINATGINSYDLNNTDINSANVSLEKIDGVSIIKPFEDSYNLKCFGGDETRDYVLTESIHEKRLYQAAVYTSDKAYFFKSKELVENDCSMDLSNFEEELRSRVDGSVLEDAQATEEFRNIVLKHIQEYIKSI